MFKHNEIVDNHLNNLSVSIEARIALDKIFKVASLKSEVILENLDMQYEIEEKLKKNEENLLIEMPKVKDLLNYLARYRKP
jgi:hypothetical protein